ncbi:hypothetical protein Pelo_942 [Pelomyxa schiedti]|nr:hypothetical protein Pelo_942 [Pelomyxa schiedti]
MMSNFPPSSLDWQIGDTVTLGAKLDAPDNIGRTPLQVATNIQIRQLINNFVEMQKQLTDASHKALEAAEIQQQESELHAAAAAEICNEVLKAANAKSAVSACTTEVPKKEEVWETSLREHLEEDLVKLKLLPAPSSGDVEFTPLPTNVEAARTKADELVKSIHKKVKLCVQGCAALQCAAAWDVMGRVFAMSVTHCHSSIDNSNTLAAMAKQRGEEIDARVAELQQKPQDAQLIKKVKESKAVIEALKNQAITALGMAAVLEEFQKALSTGVGKAAVLRVNATKVAERVASHIKARKAFKGMSQDEVIELLLEIGVDKSKMGTEASAFSMLQIDGEELELLTAGYGSWGASFPPGGNLCASSNLFRHLSAEYTTPSASAPTDTPQAPSAYAVVSKTKQELRAFINLKKFVHTRESVTNFGVLPSAVIYKQIQEIQELHMRNIESWTPLQVEKWLTSRGITPTLAHTATWGGALPGWAFMYVSAADLAWFGVTVHADRMSLFKHITDLKSEWNSQKQQQIESPPSSASASSGTPNPPEGSTIDYLLSFRPEPLSLVETKPKRIPTLVAPIHPLIQQSEKAAEDAAAANINSEEEAVPPPPPPPPDEYVCPITTDLMVDPVVAADGYFYERVAISAWFGLGHRTSPKTNLLLKSTDLFPCNALRTSINDWVKATTQRKNP